MINVLFFGSPKEVVPVLESLHADEDINVLQVITQPDRPVGRKKVMTPTPVKEAALKLGLEVITPKEFDEGFYFHISTVSDIDPQEPDVAILAAYGMILPNRLLEFPRYGFLNLHPSLLPAYRGASPCLPPILRGEEKTGLTFMQMDEAMDHGPVVAQFESDLKEDENHRDLEGRLFDEGAQVLPEVVKRYVKYKLQITNDKQNSHFKIQNNKLAIEQLNNVRLFLPPKEQDHDKATYTKLLKKEDGFLPWELLMAAMKEDLFSDPTQPPLEKGRGVSPPSEGGEGGGRDQDSEKWLEMFPKNMRKWLGDYNFPEDLPMVVERFIRALDPWPQAWTEIEVKSQKSEVRSQKLKLLSAHVEEMDQVRNGRTEEQRNEKRYPATKLVLDTVRLEGRKTMRWDEFRKGFLDQN